MMNDSIMFCMGAWAFVLCLFIFSIFFPFLFLSFFLCLVVLINTILFYFILVLVLRNTFFLVLY